LGDPPIQDIWHVLYRKSKEGRAQTSSKLSNRVPSRSAPVSKTLDSRSGSCSVPALAQNRSEPGPFLEIFDEFELEREVPPDAARLAGQEDPVVVEKPVRDRETARVVLSARAEGAGIDGPGRE